MEEGSTANEHGVDLKAVAGVLDDIVGKALPVLHGIAQVFRADEGAGPLAIVGPVGEKEVVALTFADPDVFSVRQADVGDLPAADGVLGGGPSGSLGDGVKAAGLGVAAIDGGSLDLRPSIVGPGAIGSGGDQLGGQGKQAVGVGP